MEEWSALIPMLGWADLPTRCSFLFQLITEETETAALEWDICVLAGSSKVKWIFLWRRTQSLLVFCSEPLIKNWLMGDIVIRYFQKVLGASISFPDQSLNPLLSSLRNIRSSPFGTQIWLSTLPCNQACCIKQHDLQEEGPPGFSHLALCKPKDSWTELRTGDVQL